MAERTLAVLLALVLAVAGGCGGRTAEATNDARTVPGEPPLRELVRSGAFGDKRLTEASGVVASTTEPGVLWSQKR